MSLYSLIPFDLEDLFLIPDVFKDDCVHVMRVQPAGPLVVREQLPLLEIPLWRYSSRSLALKEGRAAGSRNHPEAPPIPGAAM